MDPSFQRTFPERKSNGLADYFILINFIDNVKKINDNFIAYVISKVD